jgi:hypothetical protein
VRRASAAISTLLLSLVVIAVAEAGLVGLLFVFSYVLRIGLRFDVGSTSLAFTSGAYTGPMVQLYGPAVIASVLFSLSCALITTTWTFRGWRPAR